MSRRNKAGTMELCASWPTNETPTSEPPTPLERLGQSWYFYCPGCDQHHRVQVKAPTRPDGAPQPGPVWDFDGDEERPTFAPSILSTCEYKGGEHGPPKKTVCHSFVRGGRIEFLGDCTHALAGRTVDLPVLP